MVSGLTYKTKQFFIVVIKLSIVIGATYYIYNRLAQNSHLSLSEFIAFLSKNKSFSAKNIIFLLILTGFNWFFEILKWQKLVYSIKEISFVNALEQSLGGLTASLITPNRIGDYGAKAIYYVKQDRKRILLLNLLGNMSQMFVTVVFGCIGLILFNSNYGLEINAYRLASLGLIILVIIFFGIITSAKTSFTIKGYGIHKVLSFFNELPKKTLFVTFSLSIIRYLIFSFQFYFLLLLCGVELTYSTAMIAITSMYLLASIVPSLAVFDVVIKTSAAVYIFSFLGINELTVLSVSTLMWLFNFILPSIFGSYFVLNFNLPKSED